MLLSFEIKKAKVEDFNDFYHFECKFSPKMETYSEEVAATAKDDAFKRPNSDSSNITDCKKKKKAKDIQMENAKKIEDIAFEMNSDQKRSEDKNSIIEEEAAIMPIAAIFKEEPSTVKKAEKEKEKEKNMRCLGKLDEPDPYAADGKTEKHKNQLLSYKNIPEMDNAEDKQNYPEVYLTQVHSPSDFAVQFVLSGQKIDGILMEKYRQRAFIGVPSLKENRYYILYCGDNKQCYRCLIRKKSLNGDALRLDQGRPIYALDSDSKFAATKNSSQKLYVYLMDYEKLAPVKMIDR